MSYDLMVFRHEAAPESRQEFMQWYKEQTDWKENHSYDDPANTHQELRDWFMEMQETFPAMNGPYAGDNVESPKITDYSIGENVIYAAFGYAQAEFAYQEMLRLAAKHGLGFFDASGPAEILVPAGDGQLINLGSSDKEERRPWWKFW